MASLPPLQPSSPQTEVPSPGTERSRTSSVSTASLQPTVSRKQKYIFTWSIFFGYFAYGMGSSLIGPTLMDLAENMSSSFKQVSYGLISRNIAYCLGSLCTGYAYSHTSRQLGYAACLLVMAVAIFLEPLVRHLSHYLTLELFVGFCSAGIDVASTAWILEIWQKDCNPYMQGLHFGFALGQAIAPLLVEPFLSPTNKDWNGNETVYNRTAQNTTMNNTTATEAPTRIIIPYSITSSILLIGAAIFLVLYIFDPYPERHDIPKRAVFKSVLANAAGNSISAEELIAQKTKKYKIFVVVLGCILLFFYTGMEFNWFTFLPQFTVCIDLHFSKSKAALTAGALSWAYAGGRLSSIFVAERMKVAHMLYAHLILILTASIMLEVAHNSETMIWISVIILGYGFSCIFPAFYSFLEARITITNTVCGYFMFASNASCIVNTLVIAHQMENNPSVLIRSNFVTLFVCYVVLEAFYVADQTFAKKKVLPEFPTRM